MMFLECFEHRKYDFQRCVFYFTDLTMRGPHLVKSSEMAGIFEKALGQIVFTKFPHSNESCTLPLQIFCEILENPPPKNPVRVPTLLRSRFCIVFSTVWAPPKRWLRTWSFRALFFRLQEEHDLWKLAFRS